MKSKCNRLRQAAISSPDAGISPAAKIDRHISRLRLRNYPAQLAPPLPGQLRAGAHSDCGSLTILATDCHLDLPWLPAELFVSEAQRELAERCYSASQHRQRPPPDIPGPPSAHRGQAPVLPWVVHRGLAEVSVDDSLRRNGSMLLASLRETS